MTNKMLTLRFRRAVAVDPEQAVLKPTEQRRQALEEEALAERCKDGDRRQPD